MVTVSAIPRDGAPTGARGGDDMSCMSVHETRTNEILDSLPAREFWKFRNF